MEEKSKPKKTKQAAYWGLGLLLLTLIVLIIIWFETTKKKVANQTIIAKGVLSDLTKKLGSTLTVPTVPVNKTLVAAPNISADNPVRFYTTDGNFTLAYTKTSPGDFVGIVVATSIPASPGDYNTGNAFYEIANTGGHLYYVPKALVTEKK